ncbi:MAG: ATP synthase F1 subunit gamma [Bacteroidetes bacterium]|nr:ATP synthase F1 subunit gamma [Bacteroidota bacterium]
MANLKEIRGRIKTVKNTQQVTKAMKMVAAAKLRRAQDRMLQLRPYAAKLKEIMTNVTSAVNLEEIPSKLLEVREVKKILFVVVTSNRGLAGPFNTNLLKHVNAFLQQNYAEELAAGKVEFMCMGRKGFEFFKKKGYDVNGKNFDVLSDLTFDNVNQVIDIIFEKFEKGEVDKVHLAYNEFKNVMSQIRQVETLLPLSVEKVDGEEKEAADDKFKSDYIFEPDREKILLELIPKALRVQVFRGVLESNAAEQGARMVAMDTATENAEELLKELKLSYNKARQAAITKEILEIAAGADALASQ